MTDEDLREAIYARVERALLEGHHRLAEDLHNAASRLHRLITSGEDLGHKAKSPALYRLADVLHTLQGRVDHDIKVYEMGGGRYERPRKTSPVPFMGRRRSVEP